MKLGVAPASTVTVTVAVEWDNVPLAPVTVKLKVLAATVGATKMVSVETVVVGSETGSGTNIAETPVGRVDVDNWTVPLKPFRLARVTVLVPGEPPAVMEIAVGEAEMLKSGGGSSVP